MPLPRISPRWHAQHGLDALDPGDEAGIEALQSFHDLGQGHSFRYLISQRQAIQLASTLLPPSQLSRPADRSTSSFFSQFPEPETYDPEVGPWPDLALEIEVTRSALDRMAIYRDLSIREVWRYSPRHEICIERLGPDGYSASETSVVLPGLKVYELPRFVQLGFQDGPRAMLKAFKAWLSL